VATANEPGSEITLILVPVAKEEKRPEEEKKGKPNDKEKQ